MVKAYNEKDLIARLKEFDYIDCPRCGNGVFTEDIEGIGVFPPSGLPTLLCPYCLLEYDLSLYLESDDDD